MMRPSHIAPPQFILVTCMFNNVISTPRRMKPCWFLDCGTGGISYNLLLFKTDLIDWAVKINGSVPLDIHFCMIAGFSTVNNAPGANGIICGWNLIAVRITKRHQCNSYQIQMCLSGHIWSFQHYHSHESIWQHHQRITAKWKSITYTIIHRMLNNLGFSFF